MFKQFAKKLETKNEEYLLEPTSKMNEAQGT